MNKIWNVKLTKDAEQDYLQLDGSIKKIVKKAIDKVALNPLPKNEGGYGSILSGELHPLLKIKLKGHGIRIIYKLDHTNDDMKIIIIGVRANDNVYDETLKRIAITTT